MCKPLPPDTGTRIKAIIDQAIADIEAIGADHTNACALVSFQSLIRIDGDLMAGLAAIKNIRDEANQIWHACQCSDGESIN